MERSLRLRKDYDVRAARSEGKSYPVGPLVARIRPNGLEPVQNRYTAVASKKVGKAHERNRCKRLVREALRHLHPDLQQGFDVVIVIRGGVAELTGYPVARATLDRIFARAKMLTVPPPSSGAPGAPAAPPVPAPAETAAAAPADPDAKLSGTPPA